MALRTRVPAGKRLRRRLSRFSVAALLALSCLALGLALGLWRFTDLRQSRLFSRRRPRAKRGRLVHAPKDAARPAELRRELAVVAGREGEGKERVMLAQVRERALAAWEKATAEDPDADLAYEGYVYSMWHEHSFAFSQVAYRNTETMLALLPNAKYRFFEFAPIQSQGYRIADGLSRMHFQRYAKRGYDMRMRMANELWGPYVPANPNQRKRFTEKTNVGQGRARGRNAGQHWWMRHRHRFRYSVNNHGSMTTVQPHPRDAFFMTLVHLYLTGGIYTDHTVAFRHLDTKVPAQAAFYGDGCLENGKGANLDGTTDGYLGWDVGLPMAFGFAEGDHPVLQCLLKKYDAAATGETQHFSPLETYCLLPGAPRKDLSHHLNGEDQASDDYAPPPATELGKLRPGHGGCARHLFESCVASTGAFVQTMPIAWRGCSDDFHWHQWEGTRNVLQSFNGIAAPFGFNAAQVDGVWTGAAYQGLRWEEPSPDHFVVKHFYDKHPATRWATPALKASLLASQMRQMTEVFDVPDKARLFEGGDPDFPSCSARIAPCHQYYADYPSLLDEVAGESAVPRSGRRRPPQSPKNMAQVKCSPSLIVPGVEKGATTYLFTLLYQHPQILPPLRGAGFKESGAYLARLDGPRNLWEKGHRFPYIRRGEPFVTGDATIQNMMDEAVPSRLLRDQPNPRVIFSLRDPTDRAWSGYRFSWGVYYGSHVPDKSFPNIVFQGIDSFSDCLGGKNITQGDWETEVQSYFKCRWQPDPYHTVWKGVYYYPVLQWMRIFGPENVLVVTSEELIRDTKRVLREIFDFAGFCTEGLDLDGIIRGATINKTPQMRSDEIGSHGKNDETTRRLVEFYRPHNEKLYELIGRRLPWVE